MAGGGGRAARRAAGAPASTPAWMSQKSQDGPAVDAAGATTAPCERRPHRRVMRAPGRGLSRKELVGGRSARWRALRKRASKLAAYENAPASWRPTKTRPQAGGRRKRASKRAADENALASGRPTNTRSQAGGRRKRARKRAADENAPASWRPTKTRPQAGGRRTRARKRRPTKTRPQAGGRRGHPAGFDGSRRMASG